MRTYIFYLIAILLTGVSAFAGGKHPPSGSAQQSSQTDRLDFTMPEDFTFEYDFFETVKVVGCGIPCDTYSMKKDGPVHFYVAPGTTFCLSMGWWTVNKETGQQVWASEVQPKSFSTASTDLSYYH